jgi:hypothetical protein
MLGATQSCCEAGLQTCTAGLNAPSWGPCLATDGRELSCCALGEFSSCDGGSLPDGCTQNEFNDCKGGLPPRPTLCQPGGVNVEPEILVGYSPADGQSVSENGKIRVWISDEAPPIIAPNEWIDPSTGVITKPGDRTAKAPDGYLWEPALYVAPQSVENGGTPHFPTLIKGYTNSITTTDGGHITNVSGLDPVPPGSMPLSAYTGEYLWDVQTLGLGPGTYVVEFVIRDGDLDLGIGCTTIRIQQ